MRGPGPFMNGSAMTFVLVNGPAAITLRDWQQRGDVDSARSDHAPSNRRKGSVTAQAAGWTVLPVRGGLPRADLFMALPDPRTPCFYLSSESDNNDVGENLFEDEQTADSAKWIAASLAGATGTLERCGARARQATFRHTTPLAQRLASRWAS
jgi:hypothetical protein